MNNYTMGFEFLKETLQHTSFLQINFIVALIFIIITLLIITRDIEKWKLLALPVSILWEIIGVPVHLLILISAGIMFAIEILSLTQIGNLAEALTKTFTKSSENKQQTMMTNLKTALKSKTEENRLNKKLARGYKKTKKAVKMLNLPGVK
jgi:Ni/Fe-hydrogenase subunit HybB-like protein